MRTENEAKCFRVRNVNTGEYLQRNGQFGRLPRTFATIGHLKNSILSLHHLSPLDMRKLRVEEVTTVVSASIDYRKLYEEASAERDKKKDEEIRLYRIQEKKRLEAKIKELNKLI